MITGQELWAAWPFCTERSVRRRYTVACNVEAIIEAARSRSQQATFWLLTFSDVSDEKLCRQEASKFLARLRKKTGVCGLRVNERGWENGRLHQHLVLDRYVDYHIVEKCKQGLATVGWTFAKDVADGNVGEYLYKELVKQIGWRRSGTRRWATFGKFEGKTLLSDVYIESPEKYWLACAWATKIPGESARRIYARGIRLYLDSMASDALWEEGVRGCKHVVNGDAWEESGPDGGEDVDGVPF